jgi:hypothetical protein
MKGIEKMYKKLSAVINRTIEDLILDESQRFDSLMELQPNQNIIDKVRLLKTIRSLNESLEDEVKKCIK